MLADPETSMKSELLHPRHRHSIFPSMASLLLIRNLSKKPAVCVFVRPCVRLSVCLCTCCWAQWHSADIMATRPRDCCGIFTKDVNFFFFSMHLNQRRLFFLKTRRLLVQRLFSILQFCLVWVLFVHSLMYFSLSWISQDWIWDALIIILNILVHSGCTAVNILWPTPMPLQ